MSTETLLDGRLVAGHPATMTVVKDRQTKQVKTNLDGTPRMETFFSVAIPKTPGLDWKQTPWGTEFVAAAVADFKNGEHLGPTFHWKVTDGDSAIPNSTGKKPCEREGYPGHWVVNCSTGFAVPCFHAGKYGVLDQIKDPKEVKCGDYCLVKCTHSGNGSTQSPGIYVNPVGLSLTRPGEAIQTGTFDAQTAFVGAPAAAAPLTAAPAAAAVPLAAPAAAAVPVAAAVAPNPAFLDAAAPVARTVWIIGGVSYGPEGVATWTPEQRESHVDN